MSNLCKPVYIVNALPKLRSFSSETETYHFREQWTTAGSCGIPSFLSRPYHSIGIVLEILPGKFSQWNNVPFSVSGTLCFCHLWTLPQIQEGRCGTIGSCWRTYLHLYPTLIWIWKERFFSLEDLSPSPDLLRGCSRETWKQVYSSSLLYQPE